MRKFLNILEAATLIALLIALSEMIAIERSLRQKLPPILASTQIAATKIAVASDALADSARKQNRDLDQMSRELNKTVANAHDLLVHTDISLNGRNGSGGVLPTASALLADQQLRLDAIEARACKAVTDLDSAEQNAQTILASLNQAAGNAANVAGNRDIPESLQRLDIALAEADATLANLQTISASGNRDARMIENRLHQALKPASLLKSALLHALSIAAPAAQIVSSMH